MRAVGFIVNLDREEYVHQDTLGTPERVLQAVSILLTDGPPEPGLEAVVGRWAGQRIAFASDNGQPGQWSPGTLEEYAFEYFTDISGEIAVAIDEPQPFNPTEES